MKRKTLLVVLSAACVALMLSGCGRHYVMDRPDMYLAPSLEGLPEKVTVLTYAVNPVLDLSEGGDGRFSWKAVMWDKAGEETSLLALNLAQFIGDKRFLVVIPKPLSEVVGSRLAVFDHGGKRIYNMVGEYRLLDSLSGKVKIADFKDFLLEIGPDYKFVREMRTDSAEFRAITQLYSQFRIKELKVAQKYIYERYGSNLTSEQLDKIATDDSIVRGFVDWLGRDWKLFVIFPFMDIASSALVAGIMKVFTLPSIWGDRIDRPGYMEHRPDAEFTAKMFLRGLEEYGQRQTVTPAAVLLTPQADHRLSETIKASLKGTPCESAETYEAYNKCAAEYNKKITIVK